MHKLIFSTFLFVLCFVICGNAQRKNTASKTKNKVSQKNVQCKSNNIFFPCPKEYKILLNGNGSNGIFLAQNLEFGYSVFVIAPKNTFNKQSVMTETTMIVLKAAYPKESADYHWKDAEFANNKATSKFEVSKKLSMGFNGSQVVTIDYRHILFGNKNVIVGTFVNGFDKGNRAEIEFNDGIPTSSGACFDAVKIIHSITGEKESDESDPCKLTINSIN